MTLPDEGMHDLLIPDDSYKGTPQTDYSAYSQDWKTRVLFKDLERHLIEYIRSADVILGCVAWLTSEPILNALAEASGVSIIVQKEDFLRPDLAHRANWARRLRRLYERLPQGLSRFDLRGTVLSHMTVGGDTTLDPIRCVGNYNADKFPAFPRSHHKFVLFCRNKMVPWEDVSGEPCEHEELVPEAVWTGSFNFTKTAGMSFENAIVLKDPAIVGAYYQEYGQIAALSEPLDWEQEWAAPEWRIGT